MYRIIKVLNNNGLLVYHNETGRELIFLGNGVGFGKKPTQQVDGIPGAKVYSLVTRRKEQSVLKVVNGIRPEFIEVAGKIIEEAEHEFRKSAMTSFFRWRTISRSPQSGRGRTGRSQIPLRRTSGSCSLRNMQWRSGAETSSGR